MLLAIFLLLPIACIYTEEQKATSAKAALAIFYFYLWCSEWETFSTTAVKFS